MTYIIRRLVAANNNDKNSVEVAQNTLLHNLFTYYDKINSYQYLTTVPTLEEFEKSQLKCLLSNVTDRYLWIFNWYNGNENTILSIGWNGLI